MRVLAAKFTPSNGRIKASRRKWWTAAIVVLALGLVVALFYSSKAAPSPATVPIFVPSTSTAGILGTDSPVAVAALRKLELRIDGMYCPACLGTVRARLRRLGGVSDVKVWMGGASVNYDPMTITPQEVAKRAAFYVYKVSIERDTPIN